MYLLFVLQNMNIKQTKSFLVFEMFFTLEKKLSDNFEAF